MARCVFCSIVSGEEPSEQIYSDEQTVAFLDIAQATRGHTLVIPRAHRVDLSDIEPQEVAAVMRTARHVAALLRAALDAPAVNLFHATGVQAWQTVFHFHMHVVPRYDPLELALPWIPQPRPVSELAGLAAQIRASTT